MRLIIFDVDGTIADRDTHKIYPDVVAKLATLGDAQLAIATNQGGVGLRYWMTRDGFGEPDKYPDEATARDHIRQVIVQLYPTIIKPYVCFAYQSQKSYKWSPVPEGQEDNPEWSQAWRKPNPGMLLAAMKDARVTPDETLFVGNDIEDAGAAKAAKCAFQWDYQFFGRMAK